MIHNRLFAAAGTLLLLLAGLAVAVFAPSPAAQVGAVAAGLAVALLALALRAADARQSELALTPQEEIAGPALPEPAWILNGFDDPLLLVRGHKVLLANPPARELLGARIEGLDIRLAIRHPAAAELLTGQPGDPAERARRTELVGLGGPERRWEMATASLPDGSRLVRLSDRSQVHAAEQSRADFVANASHELRTPLATLLGFLETLEDEAAAGDPKTRNRFLKVMFDEATRMRGLVDDLMSLSRIEAERYTVPRDPVDLVPLAEEVRVSLHQLLDARGGSILVENEAGGTVTAGDRIQLAQMLSNLVSNAVRYGRPGAPVRVRFEDAGPDLLRLSVIDQGDGIPAEHIPRLTERFYRVDAGRSRSVGGTGLGLAIVKHIVERHRGRMEIRSRIGEGTVVNVTLPRAPSQS